MSLLGVMVELTVCHSWILAALQARRKGRGPKQAFPCPMLTSQVPSCFLLPLSEQVTHDKLSGDGVLLCLLDIATLPRPLYAVAQRVPQTTPVLFKLSERQRVQET